MTTNGSNWGDQRIADLGKSVAKIPVLSLVSRCYQMMNANVDRGMSPWWNLQTFQNMFSDVVINPNIPMPLVAYDDVEQVFFHVFVTKVEIGQIDFIDDENRNIYPTYNVTASITHKREFIGDELHFYERKEYRAMYDDIKKGWDMIRALFPNGQMTVPFDRKITPFDICEAINFTSICYRLLQFAIWEIGSFSDYPVEFFNAQAVNKYSLVCMDVLMAMTVQAFSVACRLPNNPKPHFIYARPCILWHDIELPREHKDFIRQFAGIKDLEDARLITAENQPSIYWNPIATCNRHDIQI
ncbi:MAG: hypothetical protein NC548_40200 [Lachnospiraceae bacterium]|nr:hypothetical protein [Lachnospiraceae bacterium]